MPDPDPTTVRLSHQERRDTRITSLVTPSTLADWKTLQTIHGLSAGDLFAWAVKLLKQHPELFDEDYELRKKE